jgi:peptidoglycan/LPS O-acetylase OafA/YrhL
MNPMSPMNPISPTRRIQPVDGLRAFAVLGVIWAHCWMFFGNLPWTVAHVNLIRLLAFGGIGVDLFFVISGFCMYLMHAKDANHFGIDTYGAFLKKRWLRIAPAFYFVVTFESFKYLLLNGVFPLKSFVYHLLFINTFNKDNVLSPPFWSLATEWHFYIILPFLFIRDAAGKYLYQRVTILMLICLAFRLQLYYGQDLTSGLTIPNDKIWYRFVEFGFGILAARFYLDGRRLTGLFRGNHGFILTFLIAFLGRMCMTTEFLAHFGRLDFVVRALGEPILTLGFGLMILNLVTTSGFFARFIALRPFLFIGRISYSMYLWHWMIAVWICGLVHTYVGVSALYQEVAFLLVVAATTVVGFVSHTCLEAPYFRKRAKKLVPT